MSEILLHTACIKCSSEQLKPLDHFSDVGLVKCSDCSFVFTEKIPSKTELVDYYSNEYERTNYLSPITEKRYNQLLDGFEKYRKNNRILDIGAGCGFFITTAKKRGWEVYGTELSKNSVAGCKNLNSELSYGELHELQFPEESFDVVVNLEVIEHLNNPIQFVGEISRILRKGGITYLTTPNFNAIHRFRLKEKYDVISYPNHLCYYTPKTIKKLFKANNFTPKKVITTGYSFTRLRTSKGTSNQSFVSETSDDEMLRYKIESNNLLKFLKWTINGLLITFNLGDSLKATFIKNN